MYHCFKSYFAILFACSFSVAGDFAHAQSWTQTSANTGNQWGGISSSADGTKLMAGGGDGIYLSTNSGATWALSYPIPAASILRNQSSADGTKLAVVAWEGEMFVYTSTNSGTSWAQAGTSPMGGWNNSWNNGIRGMNSSANGDKLFVFYSDGTSNSGVYISTDWGATWSMAASIDEPWNSTACTADGTKIAGLVGGYDTNISQVFVSTNTGATWQPVAPTSTQSASDLPNVFSTADGSKLMVGTGSGLFISTNWGQTWSATNNYLGAEVVCSTDGSLLAGMYPVDNISFGIYTSTNFGVTWTSNSLPEQAWSLLACSADGNELILTSETNGIWISKTVPSPRLKLCSSKTNINVSWIVPSTNMVLQESPDLTNWATLTNVPCLNYSNLQEQLSLSPGNSNSFFRLVSQ